MKMYNWQDLNKSVENGRRFVMVHFCDVARLPSRLNSSTVFGKLRGLWQRIVDLLEKEGAFCKEANI